MAYELTCPSCQARLLLEEDTSTASLVCPQCGGQVPNPARPTGTSRQVSWASITDTAPKPILTNPVANPKVKGLWGPFYSTLLAGTLLAIAAVIWIGFPGRVLMGGPGSLVLNGGWVHLLNILNLILTALIVYPIGVAFYRKTRTDSKARRGRSAREHAVIIMLLLLMPVALFVVFFTVCATAAFVMVKG